MKTIDFKGLGSPKTMREAIRQGMMLGPLNELENRMFLIMRYFLANAFNVEYLRADEKTLEALHRLFNKLTKDE